MKATKELIADIKKCNTIIIRIDNHNLVNTTMICKYQERIDKRGWIKPEVFNEHEIVGKVSSFSSTFKPFEACFVSMYSKDNGNWQALAQILRPDDKVTFIAMADTNTIRETNLHTDMLMVDVHRTNKRGTKRILNNFVLIQETVLITQHAQSNKG